MRSLLLVATLIALLSLVACAKPPPPPAHAVLEGAIPLSDEARMDELNCPDGNCVHWYRVNVPRRGKLRIFVQAFELAGADEGSFFSRKPEVTGPPGFEITLSNDDGKLVAEAKSDGQNDQALESKVVAGDYYVSVGSDEPGRDFGYRLTSTFQRAPRKARPRPKPKVPQFESRAATILEAEGWGTDVEAVLIDLGSSQGMAVGFRGRLMDEGKEVGKIKIKEVFPDGSRAVLVGELEHPLGPRASAEILIPIP